MISLDTPPSSASTPASTRSASELSPRHGEKIGVTILEHVVRRELGIELFSYLSKRGEHRVLQVSMSVGVPIVGIGAAARHILPAVAASLGTKAIFPPNLEVGNALGVILIASASP